MARRFPSIRINSSSKKEEKKKRLSTPDYSTEEFPRNGGNTIPLTFGQSLEQLYSKPNAVKKANTILPVTSSSSDTANHVTNGESGSACHPAMAIYKPANRPNSVQSLAASLKRSVASTLNLQGADEADASATAETSSLNNGVVVDGAEQTAYNKDNERKGCCCFFSPTLPKKPILLCCKRDRRTVPAAVAAEDVEVPRRIEDVMRLAF